MGMKFQVAPVLEWVATKGLETRGWEVRRREIPPASAVCCGRLQRWRDDDRTIPNDGLHTPQRGWDDRPGRGFRRSAAHPATGPRSARLLHDFRSEQRAQGRAKDRPVGGTGR